MLVDARSIGTAPLPAFDICIIGAGPAGITLALELERTGKRICVVESGGTQLEEASQKLCVGHDVGMASGLISGRVRQLGGASNHWGGRTGYLDELDMTEKPWAPATGWPIERSVLDPYYARARKICGISPPPDEARVAARLSWLAKAAGPDLAAYHWWYTPRDGPTGFKFFDRYCQRLAASRHIQLVHHANVERIVPAPDGATIISVELAVIGGSRSVLSAKTFVLCTGAIENSRLLLVGSGDRVLGNGNVGRYFMQHLRGVVARVYPVNDTAPVNARFNGNLFGTGPESPACEAGIQLSPGCRKREHLLNAAGWFSFHGSDGVDALKGMGRSLLAGQWPGDIGQSMWDILSDGYLMSHLMTIAQDRALPMANAELLADVEQLPDRDSRITLSADRNSLGSPMPVVDWRSSELELRAFRKIAHAGAALVTRLGLGRVRLSDWIVDDRIPLARRTWPSFHFMGGTRMAQSADRGVVDPNCRVFGLNNLFVGGSSVFPSGGHVNPTLTIVALAIRLADHLARA